jgi:hypothetical protein
MMGLSDGILRCICFFVLQDIESDDEDLDEVDDGAEDEPEHELEDAPAEPPMKTVAPPAPPKDTERQLSKKELKKKELAELDAVLAELGLSGNSSNAAQDDKNGKCYNTLCFPSCVLWFLNHACMITMD